MRRTLTLVTWSVFAVGVPITAKTTRWSREERDLITSLRISTLGELPADPTNRVADDKRAVAFGHRLFFDTRLSANGKVACATCHDPQREFQDGTPLAQGVGTTDRRTMPIASTAHSPFQFWDGRKDSQWAQALGPLESGVEHGGTRSAYAHTIARHYKADYESIFGALPSLGGVPANAGPVDAAAARASWEALPETTRDAVTRVYVNIGKSIAAYERRIATGPSRFDAYAEALAAGQSTAGLLNEDEEAGLRLFIGKAQCSNCHNGPRLTDDHFHNTGVPQGQGRVRDDGRVTGARAVLTDEFNCRSRWSDDTNACRELEFMVARGPELMRAFKTPSLRNVAQRAPYMHAGQFADLDGVVAHYASAPRAPLGTSELKAVRLTARERAQLVAFLTSLSGPLATPAYLLEAPR